MKHLLEYNFFKYNQFNQLSDYELKEIEDLADELFSDYNIDVVFTKHFKDRLRDPREINNPITFEELEKFFINLAGKAGKEIGDLPLNKKAVIKDIVTKLNTPIQIKMDRQNPRLKDMNMVTIMRNKDFKHYPEDVEIKI